MPVHKLSKPHCFVSLESGIVEPCVMLPLVSLKGVSLLLVRLQDQQHEVEFSSLSQAVIARTQSEQQAPRTAPFPLHEQAHQVMQRAQQVPQQQPQLQDTLMQLQQLCNLLSQQLQQASPAPPQ